MTQHYALSPLLELGQLVVHLFKQLPKNHYSRIRVWLMENMRIYLHYVRQLNADQRKELNHISSYGFAQMNTQIVMALLVDGILKSNQRWA